MNESNSFMRAFFCFVQKSLREGALAWEDKAGNLFNVNDIPPSLIIQDELHLISGALGSLAGLYEIAVDWLCRKNNVSPKIIASTATVKNTDEQILNIYGQKMMQFPPNGFS